MRGVAWHEFIGTTIVTYTIHEPHLPARANPMLEARRGAFLLRWAAQGR
jgi:hypothetical protein